MKLTPVHRKSLSESIAQQLRRHIFSGRIKAGAKLPPERELAGSLGTNRNTLREAIRSLESLGLVTVRQGDGVRVTDFRSDAQLNLLPFYLLESPPQSDATQILDDLLLLRRTLLALAAKRAALRPHEQLLVRLRTLVELQEDDSRPRSELVKTDLEFFATLIRASGSLVMRWMFNSFVPIYDQVIEAFPQLWFRPDGYVDFLKQLLEAVEKGEATSAHDAVRKHFEKVDQEIVDLASILATGLERPLGELLSNDPSGGGGRNLPLEWGNLSGR